MPRSQRVRHDAAREPHQTARPVAEPAQLAHAREQRVLKVERAAHHQPRVGVVQAKERDAILPVGSANRSDTRGRERRRRAAAPTHQRIESSTSGAPLDDLHGAGVGPGALVAVWRVDGVEAGGCVVVDVVGDAADLLVANVVVFVGVGVGVVAVVAVFVSTSRSCNVV